LNIDKITIDIDKRRFLFQTNFDIELLTV